MEKINLVKITVTSQMYLAVPANTETEAIVKAREEFRAAEKLTVYPEDIIQASYMIDEVFSDEVAQILERTEKELEKVLIQKSPGDAHGQNH